MNDPLDYPGCKAIIESIERRWEKADQDVFIAAVILNPFHRISPFTQIEYLINANILDLFSCLYQRFNNVEPVSEFFDDAYNYINQQGKFSRLESMVQAAQHLAVQKVHSISYVLLKFTKIIFIRMVDVAGRRS